MHHAYLVIDAKESGIRHALGLFDIVYGEHEGNPDVQVLSYQLFGVAEARNLKEWSYQKPVGGGKRVFVITCDQMTMETQNALLKLFEEPPATAVFALVMRDVEQVLPTLRSRFEVVTPSQKKMGVDVAQAFLKLSLGERLKEIVAHTKEKDIVWVHALLASLEVYYVEQLHKKGSTTATEVLKTILFVRTYIDRRGASPKMLLEHLALALR